ncbi:MAG: inorganic diphosphatase [Acidobacteriota bacterium]|nr:inorganic diphosphatase [Acidobacteriota bacterium]
MNAIIETPKGSPNTYLYDPIAGTMGLEGHLEVSMVYPADFGVVGNTLDVNGDLLRVVVLTEFPTFPSCRIDVKILGVCRVMEEGGERPRLLAVPLYDGRWASATDLSSVPAQDLDRIAHFFGAYRDLDDGRRSAFLGWEGPTEARDLLAAARARFDAAAGSSARADGR